MKFSKTTEYALRILSHMALQGKEKYTADDIHRDLGIPYRYMRRLLSDLSRSGLISSDKGRGGGFSFAKRPDRIFLSDIIAVTGDFAGYESCIFGYGECVLKATKCKMHDRWIAALNDVKSILQTTSLADINQNIN